MKERFSEVKVTEGDIHNYLGMTFNFSIENKVKVTMNTYVEEMLQEWEVTGKASSPALPSLFEVTQSYLQKDNSWYFTQELLKYCIWLREFDQINWLPIFSQRCK